jgi:thiol-disulfide isomerase/thioredoxin
MSQIKIVFTCTQGLSAPVLRVVSLCAICVYVCGDDIMLIKKDFTQLEEEIVKTGKTLLDYLAPEIGKAYIVAITREGCISCDKQKPKLLELEKTMTGKYADRVIFTQIYVRQSQGLQQESLRSKDTFNHYFYPTNLILLRTADRGVIEYYRCVSPEISELKRNIENAARIATMFEGELN